MPSPPVSVVIPARDDAELLAAAVASVLAQDYDAEVEVIVADGSASCAAAEALRARFPGVRVVPNPDRTTPSGLNRAVAASAHDVIVRCDVRSVLPPRYIALAVETLRRTGAAVVGGRLRPAGTTGFERAVALAMTTPLGAGDSRYRIGGPEGPADMVYLGVFRRDALLAAGGFDETLPRNQDYELNWRLRDRGETVWFNPEIHARYRPRGSLRALARQYFDYGRWKRVVLSRHPRSLRRRQLAPPALVLGLAASGALAAAGALGAVLPGLHPPPAGASLLGLSALVPGAWLCALTLGSAWVGVRRRSPAACLLPLVLATMHLGWGIGFVLSPSRLRSPRRAVPPREPDSLGR